MWYVTRNSANFILEGWVRIRMTDHWDSREDADIQVITVVGTFPLTAPCPSSVFPPNGFFGFIGVGLKTLLIYGAWSRQTYQRIGKRNETKPRWRHDFPVGKELTRISWSRKLKMSPSSWILSYSSVLQTHKKSRGDTTRWPIRHFHSWHSSHLTTALFRFHVSNGFSFPGLKRAAFLFPDWKWNQKCRDRSSNGEMVRNWDHWITQLLVHHDMVTFARNISTERTHGLIWKWIVILQTFARIWRGEVDAPIDNKTIDLWNRYITVPISSKLSK